MYKIKKKYYFSYFFFRNWILHAQYNFSQEFSSLGTIFHELLHNVIYKLLNRRIIIMFELTFFRN